MANKESQLTEFKSDWPVFFIMLGSLKPGTGARP